MYQSWGDDDEFPRDWVEWANENNKVPLITWEPWKFSQTDFDQPEYRLHSIATGQHDIFLKKWLKQARDSGRPLFIRFAHEMNGNWYPWGDQVNSHADYREAWRHVVDVGKQVGATNITWVWSPNEVMGTQNLDEYYPGDDYVDWIGISGFNWGGLEPWQSWRNFNQIFAPTLRQVKKYDKPIMLAEIGAIENPRGGGQTKAAWIKETLDYIKKSDPPIDLFIWFNLANETSDKVYHWEIDSTSLSVQAMKDGLADPAFASNLSY